jgi:hypothetical protein
MPVANRGDGRNSALRLVIPSLFSQTRDAAISRDAAIEQMCQWGRGLVPKKCFTNEPDQWFRLHADDWLVGNQEQLGREDVCGQTEI